MCKYLMVMCDKEINKIIPNINIYYIRIRFKEEQQNGVQGEKDMINFLTVKDDLVHAFKKN